MESVDNAGLARALYGAYAAKDRAAAEALIDDDFRFSSPFDNRIGRGTYFAVCWPASGSIEAFDIVHLFEKDGRVAVTYEGQWQDGRRFRNTEVLTFRHGKLVEAEVYFGWTIPHDVAPGCHESPG